MSVTQTINEKGDRALDTSSRYVVVDVDGSTYYHHTEGVALARVTAIMTRHPNVNIDEERIVETYGIARVKYTATFGAVRDRRYEIPPRR